MRTFPAFEQNPRPDRVTFQWSLNAWGLESHSAGGLWDIERRDHAPHPVVAQPHPESQGAALRPAGLDQQRDLRLGHRVHHGRFDHARRLEGQRHRAIISSARPGTSAPVALEKARIDRNGGYNFTLHVDDNLFDKNGNGVLDGADYGYGIASGDFRRSSLPIVDGAPVPGDRRRSAHRLQEDRLRGRPAPARRRPPRSRCAMTWTTS